MTDNKQIPSRVDGLQQLVARKDAENAALRMDLMKNMTVLQQSKEAIQQFQQVLAAHPEQKAKPDSDGELARALAKALNRAEMAEQNLIRLEAQVRMYEQILTKAQQDLVWVWRYNGGGRATPVVSANAGDNPLNLAALVDQAAEEVQSDHAALFQAAEAVFREKEIRSLRTSAPTEKRAEHLLDIRNEMDEIRNLILSQVEAQTQAYAQACSE